MQWAASRCRQDRAQAWATPVVSHLPEWCLYVCVAVMCAAQARAQVEAAKQQLVLLEAEADGARIRGHAEAQAAEVRH